MWYWCAHALEHLGRVIVVGGDPAAVRRLGFSPATTMDDALEMATDVVGPSPTLTHLHTPPHPDGRRPVSLRRRLPRSGRLGPGSPWPRPTWPGGGRPTGRPPNAGSGLDYDHEWSRRYPARLARAMVLDNVTRPLARLVAPTTVRGLEQLRLARGAGHLRRQPRQPPRHPAAAHHPAGRVPPPHGGRRRLRLLLRPHLEGRALVVLAGRHPHRADRVNRRSVDTAAELLDDGWNLVIFPEGGRSPDGWAQPFRGRGRLPGPAHRGPGGPGLHPRAPGTCWASGPSRRPGRRAARAPRTGPGGASGGPR